MIRIYSMNEVTEWDELVRSFADYDVYYLSGYVRAFQLHGDGEPFLFYYEVPGFRAIYVYLRRPTAIEGVYDTITPYGYGGFLVDGYYSDEAMADLWNEYVMKMHELRIVDNFVRYHPVLANAEAMKTCSEVINLGKTVVMDLSSPEVIWDNIISKNRNHIINAEKKGVVIKHGQGIELFDEFAKIYNSTMKRDNADEYYYFKREFYVSIHNNLRDNYEMFWAEYDGNIVAMSIMLFANGRMNYHLSGSNMEFRQLAPSNLLLYRAALWGYEHGMRTFHLGGGVGSGEDNLYKFKIAFNRQSNCQFSIAKMIFDYGMYQQLVELRRQKDDLNMESHFFPLYRS